MDERTRLVRMALIGVLASIVGVAIVLAIDWFPVAADESARKIDTLYDVLLIVSVPIFVLVMTVAIYSVTTFRAKPGDMSDGAPIHGNTRLEIAWVTVPFLIVTALAVYGWIVLDDIEAKKPNTLVVNVTAQQFAWSFEYPAEKVKSNSLVLPKDKPVEFRVKTKDVIHDFWVPEFRLKTDTVPGLTTKIRVTPDRIGRYDVVCAELCGIGHSTMRNTVEVVPQARYTSWIADRKRRAGGGGGGGQQAADGKQIFTETGCNACHTLSDAGSNATIGPELNDLAADAARFGRGRDQSATEYVKESIENPNAFVVRGFPRGTMPSDYAEQLSEAEIDALVEYLLRVGGGEG
jgi:cytochrome c oxidase subunit 2